MAATHEQSFVLDRIALVGNDQLQITGGWHGIDRSYLRLAELLIERADGVTRVEPIAGSMVGGVQRWSARFPIGDPDVIRLQLRVGDALTVDLPWSGRARRRFGRVKLPVQAADAAPAPGSQAPDDRPAPGSQVPEPVNAPDEHPAGAPVATVAEE